MDQTILALLGVIITLMLYLDRGRRADLAQLRQEMHQSDAQLREEMQSGLAQLREEMQSGLAQLREEMQRGFAHLHGRIDRLSEVVMDLVGRVGRLEGRDDADATPAQTSQ